MSLANSRAQGSALSQGYRSYYVRNNNGSNGNGDSYRGKISSSSNLSRSGNHNHFMNQCNTHHPLGEYREQGFDFNYVKHENNIPSLKRRKFSVSGWENCRRNYEQHNTYEAASLTCNDNAYSCSRPNTNAYTSTSGKRDRSKLEDDDLTFMSRDDIERYSPSRKDGIDASHEAHLRYSYCAFVQNLGLHLKLPQTTIGTAMVLCHRFFVRRSHACHDRFLIATAALFLAAKSEETARPLSSVLRASSEILHKQDLTFPSYLLPIDWFEQYRERVLEAEQIILTTLDFELNVRHPYAPLTSILDKLGLSQSVLVNLALNLVSQGLRSSLWLQFKPHQIAAGAVYLAAKFLNMDVATFHHIWQEFQTTPAIIQDVVQQLMEVY